MNGKPVAFSREEAMALRSQHGASLARDPVTGKAGMYSLSPLKPDESERMGYVEAASSGLRSTLARMKAGEQRGLPYTEHP